MRKLLEELFRTYYNDVYRYLYSLSHDVSLSEDLASEVFLVVVKSIGTFQKKADIKTWLFSIARHKWYDYLRKKNRKIRTYTDIYENGMVERVDAANKAAIAHHAKMDAENEKRRIIDGVFKEK